MWEAVAQRPDLTLAQRPEVAQAITDYTEALHPSGGKRRQISFPLKDEEPKITH